MQRSPSLVAVRRLFPGLCPPPDRCRSLSAASSSESVGSASGLLVGGVRILRGEQRPRATVERVSTRRGVSERARVGQGRRRPSPPPFALGARPAWSRSGSTKSGAVNANRPPRKATRLRSWLFTYLSAGTIHPSSASTDPNPMMGVVESSTTDGAVHLPATGTPNAPRSYALVEEWELRHRVVY